MLFKDGIIDVTVGLLLLRPGRRPVVQRVRVADRDIPRNSSPR